MSKLAVSGLSWVVVLLSLLCSVSEAANSNTATGKKSRTAFTLVETVPLNGNSASFSLTSGKVGQSGNGYQIQPDNNAYSNAASAIASVPVMPYTNGTKTKAEIETQATAFLLPYATSVGNSLKAWMTANNYKASTFIYEHEVQVTGYSCAVGTVSGTQCVTTTSIPATPVYSCPSGAVLSGTTCTTTTSTPATPSYACQPGQSLSGATCTQTTTTTSAAAATYSCPAGQTLDDKNCITTTLSSSAATVSYSCPSGGTLSGNSCVSASSYSATPIFSCPSGEYDGAVTCRITTSQASTPYCISYEGQYTVPFTLVDSLCETLFYGGAVQPNTAFGYWAGAQGLSLSYSRGPGSLFYVRYTPLASCPSGSTLSGNNCISTTTISATVSGYSCPAGGSLDGATCTTTSTTYASLSYLCNPGQTLNGDSCSQTITTTTPAAPTYSCPSGQTLSGTTCILTTTTTTGAFIASYSCPAGTALSGATCLTSSSVPASISSYSCTNGLLSGNTCVISVYSAAIPSGGARSMKLTWQVSVMDSGRIVYGDPRVIDADPTYVYVTYTAKRAASGLPSAWTYPDAGILKWQLRRRDGTPVTTWTSVDTGGVYDEPSASGSDPDLGVNCLANKAISPGCPQNVIDVNTLMAMSSSSSAIIDYVRQIEPIYDNATDPATGAPTRVARIAISVDSRTLTPNDCVNETYRNTGQYGFALATTLDRYTVLPSSYPVLVNRYTTTAMSPTQSYDFSTSTSLTTSQLQTQIINPFNANGPLVPTSTISYLTNLAPITVIDTSSPLEITGYAGEGLASKTGTWNGRVFTIDASSGQRDQDQGFYRNSVIYVNIPLCRVEYARVTKNWANKEGLIAVNNQPVAMTDSWQFVYSDITNIGIGPYKRPQISTLTSAFTGPYMSSGCSPDNGCAYGGPTASTNLMTYKSVCTSYSPPINYCDDSGCGSYSTCLATELSATGQYASAIWTLAGSGSDDDSSVPVDFTSKLVDGSNQILMQQGIWGLGYQQIRIEIKLKDY